jgi:hypothetical protein
MVNLVGWVGGKVKDSGGAQAPILDSPFSDLDNEHHENRLVSHGESAP